ncbi:MAG: ABC transporter permease [Calditrichaeota bacterium]|nr:ABC transporter permease [Calditrichota bacterium]
MSILFKIAWRNLWRNPRRSWVLISSIAVGILGYFGTTSFSRGFLEQMVETTINLQGGHIVISAKGYQENPQIRLFIRNPEVIEEELAHFEGLHFAPLISFQGMISSSETAGGVVINGVDPAREPQITTVAKSIVAGRYVDGENGNHEIVLGAALAKKLNVELGEKVVLMMSDLQNDISSAAYRIVGLFRTASPGFDKTFVYLKQAQAQELAGYGEGITSFTLRLGSAFELEEQVEAIKRALNNDGLEVLTWKDRNPLLVLAIQAYDYSLAIVVGILFVAIAFSIANSFLMVIYERINELGIMMANGVLPKNIRRMLYAEALFINLLGTGMGFVVSAVILGYLGHNGLDLSDFAEGLGQFGVGAIVYPKVAAADIIVGLVVINSVVMLSVLYPAIKASRFQVVDAIRFV